MNSLDAKQYASLFDQDYPVFVSQRAKQLGSGKMEMLHAAVGISTEAGEFLDTMKKIWIYTQDFSTLNKEGVSHYDNLKEELGDIMFYIQMACNFLGVDVPQLLIENMAKLEKRYPKGYSDMAAKERADKVLSIGNTTGIDGGSNESKA